MAELHNLLAKIVPKEMPLRGPGSFTSFYGVPFPIHYLMYLSVNLTFICFHHYIHVFIQSSFVILVIDD
ncbi:hypothetical protein Sjap_004889 [Stephania japonica]|uniref:Uncharacterized protein n=1 Tax=Stephania japonica TaxID=461633 RepID=A0AAP0PLB2_9MAGN